MDDIHQVVDKVYQIKYFKSGEYRYVDAYEDALSLVITDLIKTNAVIWKIELR